MDSAEFLRHYGVKGMKWGVRKDLYRDSYNKDLVLEKGSTIQNVSGKTETILDGRPVYGAHTELDRLSYRGEYADYVKEWQSRTVYQNDLKVVADLKIPSQKNAVNVFMKTYKQDPEGMSRSIAKAKADVSMLGHLGKSFGLDVESRTVKNFAKKGDDWIQNEGFAHFNKSMMSSAEVHARSKYFDALLANGYGGVRDTHDINNAYRSEDPVIIIAPHKSLTRGNASKLTRKDIDAAVLEYKARLAADNH